MSAWAWRTRRSWSPSSTGEPRQSPRQRPSMAWSGSATSPGAWSGSITGRRSPSTGPSSPPSKRSRTQAFRTPSSGRPTSPTRCPATSRAESSSCSAASAMCCTRCAPRTSPPRSPRVRHPGHRQPRFLHPRPATAHPPASTGHLPADRRARPAADHGAAAGDVGDRPAVHGRQARAEPADHGPAGPPRRARRPSRGQRAARHTHHHGRGLVPCATPALQRERRAGVNGLRFAALVLAGLLAGSELTSRLVVHPALWRLPHDAQVKAEKAMYRRFAFVDPFLMTATVIACFAAAATEHGAAAALTFAAAGCFTVMLAMTLALNMPINLAIFRWDEEHGDPARWRQLRRRWDLIHTGRILLDSAGYALIATAVVWH